MVKIFSPNQHCISTIDIRCSSFALVDITVLNVLCLRLLRASPHWLMCWRQRTRPQTDMSFHGRRSNFSAMIGQNFWTHLSLLALVPSLSYDTAPTFRSILYKMITRIPFMPVWSGGLMVNLSLKAFKRTKGWTAKRPPELFRKWKLTFKQLKSTDKINCSTNKMEQCFSVVGDNKCLSLQNKSIMFSYIIMVLYYIYIL